MRTKCHHERKGPKIVVKLAQWTLDVHDVTVMSEFWSKAMGYRIAHGDDGNAKLHPPDGAALDAPTMWLQAAAAPKRNRNRNHHPDLRPVDGDVDGEVARLIGWEPVASMWGRQTNADPFVVLTDPEGNEFCVLRRDPRFSTA